MGVLYKLILTDNYDWNYEELQIDKKEFIRKFVHEANMSGFNIELLTQCNDFIIFECNKNCPIPFFGNGFYEFIKKYLNRFEEMQAYYNCDDLSSELYKIE